MFGPQLRQKFAFPKDELAVVRLCMKLSCCWPENDTWWKKVIRILHWPLGNAAMFPFMAWFLLTEAKNEGPFIIMQGASDCIAMISLTARGVLILRHTIDVYGLEKMLATDFKYYEKNCQAVRLHRSSLVWLPSVAYALVCVSSFPLCFFALLNPEEVHTTARVHSQLEARPLFFRLIVGAFMAAHYTSAVLNVISDGLIICTATVMQEKAATLRNMLDDLKKMKDKEQQDKDVDKIIEYHNLICTLRTEIEKICSGPLLVQLCFLVISVGSPILRLLSLDPSSTPIETICFLGSYIGWSTSQLTVYCLMCDDATSACLTLSKAAYWSYRVEMPPKIAKKLVMIMARAHRPLHFTAGKMFKINRKLLLKLLKRSYSLYSTVLRMR